MNTTFDSNNLKVFKNNSKREYAQIISRGFSMRQRFVTCHFFHRVIFISRDSHLRKNYIHDILLRGQSIAWAKLSCLAVNSNFILILFHIHHLDKIYAPNWQVCTAVIKTLVNWNIYTGISTGIVETHRRCVSTWGGRRCLQLSGNHIYNPSSRNWWTCSYAWDSLSKVLQKFVVSKGKKFCNS